MDVHPPKNGINRYWSIPLNSMRAPVDLKLSGVTGPWDLGWSADLGYLHLSPRPSMTWKKPTAGNPSTTLGHPACHHFLRLQAPWICCFFVSQRPLGTARLLRCWEDTCGWFFFQCNKPNRTTFPQESVPVVSCPYFLVFPLITKTCSISPHVRSVLSNSVPHLHVVAENGNDSSGFPMKLAIQRRYPPHRCRLSDKIYACCSSERTTI